MADAKLTALTETSVAALDDVGYTVDVSDTTDDAAGSSRKLSFNRLGGLFIPSYCDGRLTTESGVAVSTSDRTSQGTIYFTPYLGNRITIYDGTRWKLYSFTERSLALSSLTSGKNYDVFIYDNAGTLTLELSAAWTNDTTRADALTTQDGVYVKSGATTRRWLGTIRTTSTTTTEDSQSKRFVFSAYNQVAKVLKVADATTSWTYSTGSWRSANGSTANRVEIVCGMTGMASLAINCQVGGYSTVGYPYVGIDEDGTSANDATLTTGGTASTVTVPIVAVLKKYPSTGYHFYQWTEYADSGSVLYFGTVAQLVCGLIGEVTC